MGASTVTEHVALLLLPSVVVAVIVAVPLPFDVTTPLLLTVATLVLLLVQVTDLFVALVGNTVAVSCVVWFIEVNDNVVLSRLTEVALTITVLIVRPKEALFKTCDV